MMMFLRVKVLNNGDTTATLFQGGMAVMELEDTHPDSLGGIVINALIDQGEYMGGQDNWRDYEFRNRIVLD